MLDKFVPDMYYKSVYDIDYNKLKNIGTYNIDIKISDTANNYVIKNVTINVSENGDMSSKVSSHKSFANRFFFINHYPY